MTALRVGITTMATEPPGRFRDLVSAVDEGGFAELWVCVSHVNIFLLSRDKLAMVRDLAARVLPHVRSA